MKNCFKSSILLLASIHYKLAMEIEFLKTQIVFTLLFSLTMKTLYTDKAWIKHAIENLDVKIDYDECYYEDEFRHSDLVKIDVREHRHYNFLHELWIDYWFLDDMTCEKWDYYYDDWKEEQKKFKKICKENRVFGLDFFEHSVISFSLVEKRQDIGYYEFDRTRNVGYIAVKRCKGLTYKKAMEIAQNTLDEYNNRINWRIYEYRVTDENDNWLDCCTGFYKEEHAIDQALTYVRWYLQNQWIEFTKVELA